MGLWPWCPAFLMMMHQYHLLQPWRLYRCTFHRHLFTPFTTQEGKRHPHEQMPCQLSYDAVRCSAPAPCRSRDSPAICTVLPEDMSWTSGQWRASKHVQQANYGQLQTMACNGLVLSRMQQEATLCMHPEESTHVAAWAAAFLAAAFLGGKAMKDVVQNRWWHRRVSSYQ